MRPHEKAYVGIAGMFCLTLIAIMPRDAEVDGAWNALDTIIYFALMAFFLRIIWISGRQAEREGWHTRSHRKPKHKL
jgi:hypothetical protein